jgi:hypothetical protein
MSKISCLLIILMFLCAGCGGDSGSSAVPTGVPVTTYTVTTCNKPTGRTEHYRKHGHYEMWATVGEALKYTKIPDNRW